MQELTCTCTSTEYCADNLQAVRHQVRNQGGAHHRYQNVKKEKKKKKAENNTNRAAISGQSDLRYTVWSSSRSRILDA